MSNSNSKTPIAQTPANTSGKARVDLVKSDFDAVIEQKGYRVYHDKVMRCPCRTNQRTDALSSCRNCGGSGYVYINRFSTKMVLQSINLDTKFKEWSEERIGTVKITAREEEDLSFMDRITVRDAESISSEVVYPQNQNDFEGTPRLFARTIYPIVEIDDIFTFESSDKKLVKLSQGSDYTIVEDTNTIVFNNSYSSWDNFTVSIRYKHNPAFYVIDMVRDVMTTTVRDEDGRDTQVQMPVHAVGRRAHYVLDEENVDGTYLLDNSYEISCLEGVKCPLAPKNVKFSVTDSTTAIISWDDVSDVETNYVLERSGPDLIFSEIAILDANIVEYSDTDRLINEVYFYRIATRAADCQSIWSAPVGLSIAGLGVCPSSIVKNADESYSVVVASGASLTIPNTSIESSAGAYSADLPSADPATFILPDVTWTDSDGSIQTSEYGSSIVATTCVVPSPVTIQINSITVDTTPTGSTYSLDLHNSAGGDIGSFANPSVIADATIQVNGTNVGSVVAEGTFNQQIQNSLGSAVGTDANPSVIGDTTIQVNGVSAGTSPAEGTYNQLIENTAGASIGTAANPSIIPGSDLSVNGTLLGQLPATQPAGFVVQNTASTQVGTAAIPSIVADSQAQVNGVDTETIPATVTHNQQIQDSNGFSIGTAANPSVISNTTITVNSASLGVTGSVAAEGSIDITVNLDGSPSGVWDGGGNTWNVTSAPGADADIEINGTALTSVSSGGTHDQLIQDTAGASVGTVANPSVVGDSANQVNGVDISDPTVAEGTHNQVIQNGLGTAVGSSANPSIVADSSVTINAGAFANVEAEGVIDVPVHDSAGADVGTVGGGTVTVADTTIRNVANTWNDTEVAEGTHTLGLQRIVDTDGSNVDTIDYKPIADGAVFTCTPEVKDLTIQAPVEAGDTQAEFTIIADSDGTIDTITALGLGGLTVKVNGTLSTVSFSVAVSDVILIEFTAAAADTTIVLSGTYT